MISMKNRILLIFTLITLAAQVYAQDSCGIIWSPPVELSSSGITPRIAVQGETVHVSWSAGISLPYLRSTNDGLTWDTLRDLWIPDSTRQPNNRWIMAGISNLIYLWGDYVNATNRTHIAFRLSTDRGTTWSDTQRYINTRGTYPNDAIYFQNTISLRINYQLGGGGWPYILRSTDEGETWSVSEDSIPGFNMKIALSNGTLHLVHNPYYDPYPYPAPEIEYRRSTDLGDTWEITTLLSSDDGAASQIPAISASVRNRLYATWRDTKYGNCGSSFGCNIVSRQSTDNGTTWQGDQLLTEGENQLGIQSASARRGKVIAVTWFNDTDTLGANVRVSLDGGGTWCPTPLDITRGYQPQVAITERAIHVVYAYNDGANFRIHYVRGALPTVTVAIPVGVQAKWNLVSVPAHLSLALKDSVFPTAISEAFAYENNHYVQVETLKAGVGYWLKFAKAETVAVTGVPIRVQEIPVDVGWNLIGSIGSSLPVNTVETEPSGIIVSSFFGYEFGYSAVDTLFPGKAYWVKVRQAGTLILSE